DCRAFPFGRSAGRGRCGSAAGIEADRATGGDRRRDRLEAPALHRIERCTVEHPRRLRTHDPRRGDRAVGADGVLDHDLAGLAGAQRITREGRRGHRQRTQVGGGRGGSGRGTGGGGPLFGGPLLGLLLGDAIGLGLGFGGFLVGGLLLGQFARGLFLLALLVGQALALDLDLARGLLLGAGGLGGDARDGGLRACLDVGLQAAPRREGRPGRRDQGGEPAGLVEVLAGDALLGRDDGHWQQVGQCTGCTGVIRRLVTQREVVLDRVVLDRGVQAILAVGLARGLAQFVHAERADRVGDGGLGSRHGWRLGFGGGGGRGRGGAPRRLLAATGGQRQPDGQHQRESCNGKRTARLPFAV